MYLAVFSWRVSNSFWRLADALEQVPEGVCYLARARPAESLSEVSNQILQPFESAPCRSAFLRKFVRGTEYPGKGRDSAPFGTKLLPFRGKMGYLYGKYSNYN